MNKEGQIWKITGYIQPQSISEVPPINDDWLAIRGFISFRSNGKHISRMFFAENNLAEIIEGLDYSKLIELTGEHNYLRTSYGKDSKMHVKGIKVID